MNTGQTCGPVGLDLNVEPAWLQGLDGTGVVVALVDDGMCLDHSNLQSLTCICIHYSGVFHK